MKGDVRWLMSVVLVGAVALAVGTGATLGQPQSRPSRPKINRVNPAQPKFDDPVWQSAFREVYKSADDLATQEKREGTIASKIRHGSRRFKEIALTFDDGPHPGYTPKLLSLLRAERVKATFFVIGKMAEHDQRDVKQMVADGHLVANHTFSHVKLTSVPEAVMATEYRANNDLLQKITGKPVHYCRPPGGDYNPAVIRAAEANGLTTVLWTSDPGDYLNLSGVEIEDRLLKRVSNGAIILLHDGIKGTLQMLPKFIEDCRDQGYTFVRVDKLHR